MLKISKNSLKITQRPKKYPEIIYIYLYFYGRALASSRRDLDAPRRAPENLDPKKRMLGPTPSIFSRVDARRKRRNGSLATPKKYVYIGSERKATNIKVGVMSERPIKKEKKSDRNHQKRHL